MTTLETIKKDQMAARKAKDELKASLLSTLIAEAEMIGKNAGNRQTTEDEVIKVVQKFAKGVNETIDILLASKADLAKTPQYQRAQTEAEILKNYLPQLISETELRSAIAEIKAGGVDKSKIGIIMKMLKDKFGSAFDARLATSIIKE